MPPNNAMKVTTARKHPKTLWEMALAFQDIIAPPERPIQSRTLLEPIRMKGRLSLPCVSQGLTHPQRGRRNVFLAQQDIRAPSMGLMLPSYVRREPIGAKQMPSRVTYAHREPLLQKGVAAILLIACLVLLGECAQRKV